MILEKHHINALKVERERTGLDSYQLLNKTPGINPLIVSAWISGKTNKAKKEDYNSVLNLWRSMPDNRFVPLNEETKKEFKRLRAITSGHIKEIIQCPDAPEGLTENIAYGIIDSKHEKARELYVEFLISKLQDKEAQLLNI